MIGATTQLSIRRIVVVAAAALVCMDSPAQGLTETDVTAVIEAIDDYRSDNETRIIKDFVQLLSMPNVAVNLADMERNADHITGLLESRGFSTKRLNAGGAPYIYAELANPGAAESILIYAHFDGQPVQAENWAYPPFSPTLLDATVSLDLRLVPDQAPEHVRELIEAHVIQQGFHIVYEDPTAETLRDHAKVARLEWDKSGYPALRTAMDHPVS